MKRFAVSLIVAAAAAICAPPLRAQPGISILRPTACRANDTAATFRSQIAPAPFMRPGQLAPVSLIYANCSGSTWTAWTGSGGAGGFHRLGSRAPQDNLNWGMGRVELPTDVPSGYEVTVRFNVTAPATPGTYTFQWGVMQESVQWLQEYSPAVQVTVGSGIAGGYTCPPGSPEAKFLSQSAPPSPMAPGQQANASVSFANCGTQTWMPGSFVPTLLASRSEVGQGAPDSAWGLSAVGLPGDVPPGSTVTLSFAITAPLTTGTYHFSWAMYDTAFHTESSTQAAIVVSDKIRPTVCRAGSPAATFRAQIAPPTYLYRGVLPGDQVPVSVTFANCGASTWSAWNGSGSASGHHRLGSQSPGDNTNWGPGRVELPGDVPTGAEVTIPFAATIPATAGAYDFSWGILQESVQWFQEYSPVVSVTVGPAVRYVQSFADPCSLPGHGAAYFNTAGALPAGMAPGQRVVVNVSFTNCSGAAWQGASGYKLGSLSGQDNSNWGAKRFALPADVPPGYTVDFLFAVNAPMLTGTYGYSWGIMREGVAWYPDYSTVQSVRVLPALPFAVTLPNGSVVDGSGTASAYAGLRAYYDSVAPGGVMELPAAVYMLDQQFVIGKPITLRTQNSVSSTAGCLDPMTTVIPCAVFQAGVDYGVQPGQNVGFLFSNWVNGIHIDHMILDGNRDIRHKKYATSNADNGELVNGVGCSFTNSASVRAFGSGSFSFLVTDSVYVANNVYRDNGYHLPLADHNWSDGLRISASKNITVTGNYLIDGSDVDLIYGGAFASAGTHNSVIQNNVILHQNQASFAALMLDNFNLGPAGDIGNFAGLTVSGNTINCGAQLCDFGIEIGPRPWYPPANIYGGTVTGNSVAGAKQGINIDGAGTAAYPVTVYGNSTAGAWASSGGFNCGTLPTSAYNISTRGSEPSSGAVTCAINSGTAYAPGGNVVCRNGETVAITNYNGFCP